MKRGNVWYVCRASDMLQGIYVECPSRSGAKIFANPLLPGTAHLLTELVPVEQQAGLVVQRAEFEVGPRVGKTHEQLVEDAVRVYGGED